MKAAAVLYHNGRVCKTCHVLWVHRHHQIVKRLWLLNLFGYSENLLARLKVALQRDIQSALNPSKWCLKWAGSCWSAFFGAKLGLTLVACPHGSGSVTPCWGSSCHSSHSPAASQEHSQNVGKGVPLLPLNMLGNLQFALICFNSLMSGRLKLQLLGCEQGWGWQKQEPNAARTRKWVDKQENCRTACSLILVNKYYCSLCTEQIRLLPTPSKRAEFAHQMSWRYIQTMLSGVPSA